MRQAVRDEMSQPVFQRILLKLSGEALMGKQGFGVDPEVASRIAAEVTEVRQMGVQVAVVVGGGQFHPWRGGIGDGDRSRRGR